VWADTLLNAERGYVARTLVWAALSIVSGTTLAVLLSARRIKSPLLRQFAIQLVGWGFLVAAIGALEWQGLRLRDLASATRLERATWARVGFDAGIVGMGAVLTGAARLMARSAGGLGAGAGLALQGVALLVLDLQFAAAIAR
jgi:Family of unknown function (DUF6992)